MSDDAHQTVEQKPGRYFNWKHFIFLLPFWSIYIPLCVFLAIWIGYLLRLLVNSAPSMDSILIASLFLILSASFVLAFFWWGLKRTRKLQILSIGLSILLWVIFNIAGEISFQNNLSQWQAAGGTLNYQQIMPKPIADVDNAAVIYQQAFSLLDKMDSETTKKLDNYWTAVKREADERQTQFVTPINTAESENEAGMTSESDDFLPLGESYSNETLQKPEEILSDKQLVQIVEEYKPVLRLLHQANEYSQCVWPTVHAGLITEFPYFEYRTVIIYLLKAEAYTIADKHGPEAAVPTLLTGLRLGRAMSSDPYLINHLVELSVCAAMIETYQDIFSQSDVISTEIEAAMQLRDHQKILVGNLIAEPTHTYSQVRNYHRAGPFIPIATMLTMVINQPDGEKIPHLLPGYSQYDLGEYLNLNRMIVEYYRNPEWNRSEEFQWYEKIPRGLYLTNILTPADNSYAKAITHFEIKQTMTQIAGRLRMYKLENGQYPDQLDALGSVPVDLWNRQPFGYEKIGDGFRLWSEIELRYDTLQWVWER